MLGDLVLPLSEQGIGHGTGDPFPAPGIHSFLFRPFFSVDVGVTTIHFNWPVMLLLLGTLIVAALYLAAFRRPALVPRGLQNVMETVYDFVDRQIARDVIGHEGSKFTPYLLTLFSFILVLNLFEIIPGLNFPVPSRFAFPMFLAILTWIIFNYIGIKRQGLGPYLKGVAFPPGLPKWIYPILTPVEIFSTFLVRPFTLAVRLFANMFAGHVLLAIFFLGTLYWLVPSAGFGFAIVSFVMSFILVAFELLIDALQAYIFTLLTAIYISGAIAPEH